MKLLIPEAKRVALKSYSLWANYIGIAVLIVPEAIYWQWQIDLNPRTLWFLGVGLILFGTVGRLIVQPGHRSWVRVLILGLLIGGLLAVGVKSVAAQHVTDAQFAAVAVPLVGRWEGKRNQAYLDTIAQPPVWTICYGETRGVKQGDYYSDRQCADKLGTALLEYRIGLHRAFTAETITHRLTPARDAAYVSLAYNAGIYAISRSTATRRLNAGDIAGGCQAIGWWNRSGGRVIRGLANRRADEVAMCLE